jgi:hypothetical protein
VTSFRVQSPALPKQWWRPRVWPKLLAALPAELARDLTRTAKAAAAMNEQLEAIEAELRCDAPAAPVGVSAMTAGVLEREVCSWDRFTSGKNSPASSGCVRVKTPAGPGTG